MTTQYPSNEEVRAWAMSKRPDLVAERGNLPRFVTLAWSRAHPDRPYVKAQAYHGTVGGYNARNCRCERCCDAASDYNRHYYANRKADRDDELADELA